MDPMRPVDHVEEPPAADTGFLFRGPGWQSNILPVLFGSLIFLSGLIAFLVDDNSLWGTFVSGTAILIVMLATNEVLKRTLRKVVGFDVIAKLQESTLVTRTEADIFADYGRELIDSIAGDNRGELADTEDQEDHDDKH